MPPMYKVAGVEQHFNPNFEQSLLSHQFGKFENHAKGFKWIDGR